MTITSPPSNGAIRTAAGSRSISSRSSGYQTFSGHQPTPFHITDAPNFVFVMGKAYKGDLLGIKVTNTAGDKVEVHVVNALFGYDRFRVQSTSPLDKSALPLFVLGSDQPDSVMALQIASTTTGTIEGHQMNWEGDHWMAHYRTAISPSSASGHTWLVDHYPETAAVGITTGPTKSGNVEILRGPTAWITGFPPPPNHYKTPLTVAQGSNFIYKII